MLNSNNKIIDFRLSKQLTSSTILANYIWGDTQNMEPILLEQYYKYGSNIYVNG